MSSVVCTKCSAPFLKATSAFCSKCGHPRPIAPQQTTLKPLPSLKSEASNPDDRNNNSLPSVNSASLKNSSGVRPTGIAANNDTEVGGKVTNSVKKPNDPQTPPEIELGMEDSLTLLTLKPDGITPEMLETPNACELRLWKKGTLLGRGTYGSVFLGLLPDASFHAVKVVELGGKTGAIQPAELVSLSREINLMRQLKHQNLCRFNGVYFNKEDGSINMFMEFIGGGSLSSVVKKFKPIPRSVIRHWTKQLLCGLSYLHSKNIIHRDIKGDNILVDTTADPKSESQIKLADFGAAKRVSDAVARSRTVIGTPYWMAPEVVNIQGSAEGYSMKADIWSAGCTVAEMISGKPPWPSKSNVPAAILMIAQAEGGPTEIPAEDASPGCLDLMNKCFARDPAVRPSAAELLNHPYITGEME